MGTCVDGLGRRIAETAGSDQKLEAEANAWWTLAKTVDEITKFISHNICSKR